MLEVQHGASAIKAKRGAIRRHTYATMWYNKQLNGILRSTIKESIVRIQERQKLDQQGFAVLLEIPNRQNYALNDDVDGLKQTRLP